MHIRESLFAYPTWTCAWSCLVERGQKRKTKKEEEKIMKSVMHIRESLFAYVLLGYVHRVAWWREAKKWRQQTRKKIMKSVMHIWERLFAFPTWRCAWSCLVEKGQSEGQAQKRQRPGNDINTPIFMRTLGRGIWCLCQHSYFYENLGWGVTMISISYFHENLDSVIQTSALAQWNCMVVVMASGVTFICFIFSITSRLSSADRFSINWKEIKLIF